jgi:hypothetical protein
MTRASSRWGMVMVLLGVSALHAHAQSPTAAPPSANQAFITQLGQDQRAIIEQRNIAGGLLQGSIQQNGIGNEASISMEGGDLSGSISQSGNDNNATLEIRDRNNRGAIEQYGDGNVGGLVIQGESKDVTLIQRDGVQNFGYPIRVDGNLPSGLPITIRQY